MATKIIHNRIKCKRCGDVIESFTVHDFKWCRCRGIFVDGGKEYLRCGGDLDLIEDKTVEEPCDSAKDVASGQLEQQS